jgi:glyoxalase family protein
MMKLVTGLHHITALTANAEKNVHFYAGILGLRLVKKTINFDAPDVYHLYYGNDNGSPGTILTFFPFPDSPRGRKGNGQLTVTSFSIGVDALDYWIKRFNQFNVPFERPQERFQETVLYFEDFEGLGLELVANNRDDRPGTTNENIPLKYAIKGFHGMTLSEECYEQTAHLLTHFMDHTLIDQNDKRHRYAANGKPGAFVDILCQPDRLRGVGGFGTVHHVAFATENDGTQVEARLKLLEQGLNVTPVIDRQYFNSIYFREPGHVLFEIATIPPGFAVDEPFAHLGESLKLPPWEEKHRSRIEQELPPITFDIKAFKNIS